MSDIPPCLACRIEADIDSPHTIARAMVAGACFADDALRKLVSLCVRHQAQFSAELQMMRTAFALVDKIFGKETTP